MVLFGFSLDILYGLMLYRVIVGNFSLCDILILSMVNVGYEKYCFLRLYKVIVSEIFMVIMSINYIIL